MSKAGRNRIINIGAADILSARLSQIPGLLTAIGDTWDDDEEMYTLPEPHMRDALWGVDVLLDQAIEAHDKLFDEEDGKSDKPDRKKPDSTGGEQNHKVIPFAPVHRDGK